MKLRRIEIENFRAFASPIEVDIDDFTAFIGKNDIGKSSILAALTIFLEGDGIKIDKLDGSLHGDPSRVRITCEFDTLPDTIVLDNQYETSLGNEHVLWENDRLRITKMYDCSKSKINPEIMINAYQHPVDKDGESLLTLTISDLKKKAKELNVELKPGEGTVKALIRKAIIERSDAFTFGQKDIQIDKNESKTLWQQILNHLPICALFISDRSSSDQDPEAQTPMGIAVDLALKDIQDKLDDIAIHVEKQVKDVASRTLAKLSEMNSELASQLSPNLKDPNIKWKNLFKYTLTSDLDVPMDKRGSGVRRLVLLNFFRAEAERKSKADNFRPVIYAIEEPETSQHPDHQKLLMQAFLEIASNSGQVLLSTHAPGLAGEIPVESLRFIDADKSGSRFVKQAEPDKDLDFFIEIAHGLGMLPDNLIQVMICVEGWNDIRFLQHVSHTLHKADSSIPDLSCDPHYVLIPLHGGNLRDVVNLNLFRGFNKPEFHIYDRDDNDTYCEQIDVINNRNDGSKAVRTLKRTMENYIHPAAIERATKQRIDVSDDNNIVEVLCKTLRLKKNDVKKTLNKSIASNMTVEEIDERDGRNEIRGWLRDIAGLERV